MSATVMQQQKNGFEPYAASASDADVPLKRGDDDPIVDMTAACYP